MIETRKIFPLKFRSVHPLAKTNRSLHDIRISLDQLNLAERDSKLLVDDLSQPVNHESHSARGTITPQPKSQANKQNGARVKKRLDYESHPHKQDNPNDLFDRLSQPKTRVKKEKPKSTQATSQSSTGGSQNVWK